MRGFFLFLLCIATTPALAADPAVFSFDDPAQEQRFQRLTQELRCLVCQNQSLADSHAELAGDLRREIYTMMQKGRSDQAIVGFMVKRYGAFVLYRPPVTARTFLLWYTPALLSILGGMLLWRNLRRRSRIPPPALSPEERRRITELLESHPLSTGEVSAAPPDSVHRP